MTSALEGRGLHSGALCAVRFVRSSGPVMLGVGSARASLAECEVLATTRSTAVGPRDGAFAVRTVEHAFAALAGMGVFDGVRVEVEGGEVPLLDGGARAFAEAIVGGELARGAPKLLVVREGEVSVRDSRYTFMRGDHIEVKVTVDYGDARLAPDAAWFGDADDFFERIAPARTFALERDLPELERGLASFVDPTSVVLVARERIHSAGRAFTSDEPARHKLLDLLGDAYFHGGPPIGRLRAERPGHANNHAAFLRALELGLLARVAAE